MNFVFAADKNYLPHFETVLKSVMCYHENVNIFLFHSEELPEYFTTDIALFLKRRNSKFYHYHLTEEHLPQYDHQNYITNIAFARYFIPRLFQYQNDNRWCYLDIDLVVNGNLESVFEQMAENKQAVAAVYDSSVHIPTNNTHYFNSGVMFFNSDLYDLNEQDLVHVTLKNPDLKYPDQDVLNHFLKNKFLVLDDSYNYQVIYLYRDMTQLLEQNQKQFIFPKVLHFSIQYKPWIRLGYGGYFDYYSIFTDMRTNVFFGNNLFDFYQSLNWEMIVSLPINYFQPLAKQIYQQNFDYVVKGDAEIKLLD
ncbi:glycosyltransferase [Lonepinella sp. BR2474]|uniref:glycosyltransferase n=1 Tax=Lonepinella sp. BR2474 TaxID=3434548 RepID=UPI003F6DE826